MLVCGVCVFECLRGSAFGFVFCVLVSVRLLLFGAVAMLLLGAVAFVVPDLGISVPATHFLARSFLGIFHGVYLDVFPALLWESSTV